MVVEFTARVVLKTRHRPRLRIPYCHRVCRCCVGGRWIVYLFFDRRARPGGISRSTKIRRWPPQERRERKKRKSLATATSGRPLRNALCRIRHRRRRISSVLGYSILSQICWTRNCDGVLARTNPTEAELSERVKSKKTIFQKLARSLERPHVECRLSVTFKCYVSKDRTAIGRDNFQNSNPYRQQTEGVSPFSDTLCLSNERIRHEKKMTRMCSSRNAREDHRSSRGWLIIYDFRLARTI